MKKLRKFFKNSVWKATLKPFWMRMRGYAVQELRDEFNRQLDSATKKIKKLKK